MSVTQLEQQSATMLYNESHVYIQDGWTKGTFDADSNYGKKGFAKWDANKTRWFFREHGSEEWVWIQFHQLAFVPMHGDQVVCTSSDVPTHYKYDRYATLSDQEVLDRIITVTRTEWSNNGNDGSIYDQPKAWVVGEVKSRQKPDDTEQVRFRACHSPHLTYWLFTQATSLGSPDLQHRNRIFHEFHLTHARLDHVQTDLTAYRSDFTLVSEMLTYEAQNRDWCEEYDSFVDAFNNKSKIANIEERRNDYEVEVEMEVTLRIKTTVNTEARNADDAVDNVRDMDVSDIDFDLHSNISNFNYDCTDTTLWDIGQATQC